MLVGLIGANIMGSLSPALFADAFRGRRNRRFYHLIDVDLLPGRRLPQTPRCDQDRGLCRRQHYLSLQQDVIPLLDAVDPEAAQTRRNQYRRDPRRTAAPPA